MKVKTKVKAGALGDNHNRTVKRATRAVRAIRASKDR